MASQSSSNYTLAEVIAFLCGEAALDGVWMGGPHPIERGPFWWRKHLRAAAEVAVAEAERKERERCAAIADDEKRIREDAGQQHPENSESRGRCMAAARAAWNVAKGIRAGEVVASSAQQPSAVLIAPMEKDAHDNIFKMDSGGVQVYKALPELRWFERNSPYMPQTVLQQAFVPINGGQVEWRDVPTVHEV